MPKCAKHVLLFGLASALLVGCGGSAVKDGLGNGAASSVGGAIGVGGAASSTSVSGASGSVSNDPCSLPRVSGECDAYVPSFWHNPQTGVCEPFVYGGCGGNANRFGTRAACLAACPGGGADWGACQYDRDCELTTLGCCGPCEPLAENQFAAVNSMHLAELQQQSCGRESTCGACPSVTEYDATGKYFKAVCVSGECSAIDIRTTPAITACASDSDCGLRDGTGCCQECDGSGFVAVNNRADLCGGAPVPCGLCISLPPSGLRAACKSGSCTLALPTR